MKGSACAPYHLRHAVVDAAAEGAQDGGFGRVAHRQNERKPKLGLVGLVEAREASHLLGRKRTQPRTGLGGGVCTAHGEG